ncbi:hypothetical protein Xbed_02932 [Xenorhabdus beddingii]|uniref:Uncharacterized protein n=1 Tax=Xenorhabdus beddingii TaxID=40578 RepID=A0A1Y2SMG5_9GAMM|nr:hypothetical protein [Xenorhabdus beddingii]OTA18815.1 hypothetical protein Xbed_02932 [Xenorhabdus beddingii]
MAGQLKVTTTGGSSVIKGQPFNVFVEVSGETNIDPKTTEISVTQSSGVQLIKTFPGGVDKGVFSQQLVFFAAEEMNDDYQISFAANTQSKPKLDVSYKATDNPELKPETCILRGSAAYLYDPNPVAFSGTPPTINNPFVSASINPMLKNGGPISDYDIPLRATAPVRIFTTDDIEILPYEIDHQKQYYDYLIQKPSTSAVNLKIYATQDISNFVEFDTIFHNKEYNQKQVIFITTALINTSSDFEPPVIEETYSSSTLTREDQTDNFHFMIPSYPGAKSGNFIIGFVTDDEKDRYKRQLCFGQLKREQSGYYKLPADYGNLYDGDNFISYVAVDQKGNVLGSELNFINYDSSGNNSPDPNDKNRTLVAPEVYNQFGLFVGIYNPVNIHSVGTKGLEVRLLSDPKNPEHTIAVGDMITITAYISYYVDIFPKKARPLPIVVAQDRVVKSTEIINGYYKATITPDQLMGYDSADGYDVAVLTIDYSRLAPNQKSKIFTRSFGTVAPGERGDLGE